MAFAYSQRGAAFEIFVLKTGTSKAYDYTLLSRKILHAYSDDKL